MKNMHFIKITLLVLTAVIFVSFNFGCAVLAFGPSSDKIYEGIDVSEWQGNINFKKVKEAGIEVVYIRSSQGFSYEDSQFEKNYEEAKKQDLKVGVYHYVTARSEEEARTQAKFFVSKVSNKEIDCKLAMDFEYFPNLSKSEVNKIALAFIQETEKLSGKKAVVYSDAYNASSKFEGEITSYPLWIAEYGVREPENNGNWKNWEGFQYTDKGRVSGISGNVDRDKFTENILLDDTSKIPVVEKPEHKKEDRVVYRIKWGDTLTGIAEEFNTTVRNLVELNNIKNPNLIYAGDKIIVSYKFVNETRTTYLVKWGDTLSEIAEKYNTTVEYLVEVNKIRNPNLIYAGETLIIS